MRVVSFVCDICQKSCSRDKALMESGYGAIEVELTFPFDQVQRTAEVCSKACLHTWIDKELKAT